MQTHMGTEPSINATLPAQSAQSVLGKLGYSKEIFHGRIDPHSFLCDASCTGAQTSPKTSFHREKALVMGILMCYRMREAIQNADNVDEMLGLVRSK